MDRHEHVSEQAYCLLAFETRPVKARIVKSNAAIRSFGCLILAAKMLSYSVGLVMRKP